MFLEALASFAARSETPPPHTIDDLSAEALSPES